MTVVRACGRRRPVHRLALFLALAVSAAGCGEDVGVPVVRRPAGDVRAQTAAALDRGFDQILTRADSMDDALRPIALLTPAERGALRRYLNAQQLDRARALGARPADGAALETLRSAGRLVPLEDSTEHWIVRELDHSAALVVPDVPVMLTELGERFHARLDSIGIPPVRMEVTSVLRTAETQSELRESNPNAAGGTSTHEYGTTLDVAYSSFAAPQRLDDWYDAADASWLAPHLERLAGTMAETVAARRSRELQAILGQVLLDMQREGKVMVTLERQQPVFHMTLAREY